MGLVGQMIFSQTSNDGEKRSSAVFQLFAAIYYRHVQISCGCRPCAPLGAGSIAQQPAQRTSRLMPRSQGLDKITARVTTINAPIGQAVRLGR